MTSAGSYFFTVYPPGRASWYDSVYALDDSFVFGDQRGACAML